MHVPSVSKSFDEYVPRIDSFDLLGEENLTRAVIFSSMLVNCDSYCRYKLTLNRDTHEL